MQQRNRFVSIVILAVLGGCTASQSPPPAAPVPAPDPATLANARYTGVLAQPIELHDGEFDGASVGASHEEIRLVDTAPLGDIDANGVAEAATLLRRSGGGSGSFVYLGIADRNNLAAIPVQLIGDRVQIRTLGASSGEVYADVVRAGEDDAVCCPGETLRLTWRYTSGGLSAPREGPTRRLDIGDLAGAWRLTALDGEAPHVHATLRIDGNRLQGRAVCNGYSGELVLGMHPGQLHIGPVATTAMACPDEQDATREHAYLRALSRVQTYSFAPDQLLFGYFTTPDADGAAHVLTFARDDTPD